MPQEKPGCGQTSVTYKTLFSSSRLGNSKIPIFLVEFKNPKEISKLCIFENLTEHCNVGSYPVQYFDHVLAASIVQSPNGITLVIVISMERNRNSMIFGGYSGLLQIQYIN